MKRIKAINGYTIYQITERDAKHDERKTAGNYEIYFSSDVRDYGVIYSYAEYEDIETLEIAMELCNGNYATAKEIAESFTTCADLETIETIENALNNGVEREEIENAIENGDEIPVIIPVDCGDYEINFTCKRNSDGEIFNYSGRATIAESKAFKYGNGLAMAVYSIWNNSGVENFESYDLRYYKIGNDARDFFKRFFADLYTNVTFSSFDVIKK